MIIYGKQLFWHLVKRHPEKLKKVWLAKEIEGREFAQLKRLGYEILRIDPKKAQALARGGNHQGFIAEVDEFETVPLEQMRRMRFVLFLDHVTDVGNIGAIVRSCYALGVDGLVIGGIKEPSFDGIARTSSGALFELPVALAPQVPSVLNEFKQSGFRIYGATMDGETQWSAVAPKRLLVMGSEGKGFSPKVAKMFDEKIAIAMAHDFDSLNVSVAAGILIDRMRS
ncbi:MAG: 23S rRNA (guanosine(2251)-2'-O)-methyltransferase RlmB [Campylobacterales bacterium]